MAVRLTMQVDVPVSDPLFPMEVLFKMRKPMLGRKERVLVGEYVRQQLSTISRFAVSVPLWTEKWPIDHDQLNNLDTCDQFAPFRTDLVMEYPSYWVIAECQTQRAINGLGQLIAKRLAFQVTYQPTKPVRSRLIIPKSEAGGQIVKLASICDVSVVVMDVTRQAVMSTSELNEFLEKRKAPGRKKGGVVWPW